jgi:hypothetical protein
MNEYEINDHLDAVLYRDENDLDETLSTIWESWYLDKSINDANSRMYVLETTQLSNNSKSC